jgi:hypothetical protein
MKEPTTYSRREMEEHKIRPGEIISEGKYACDYAIKDYLPHFHVWRWGTQSKIPVDWSELPQKHGCRLILPQCPPPDSYDYNESISYPCRSKIKANNMGILPTTFTKQEWFDFQRIKALRPSAYAKQDRQKFVRRANLANKKIPMPSSRSRNAKRKVRFANSPQPKPKNKK